jgi:16S rRNA G966 N2-methylase RsmD
MVICQRLYQDLIFIDPPWGGPDYKNKDSIDLYLSDTELSEVCEHIKDNTQFIGIKVPVNFNEISFIDKTKNFMKLIHRNPDLRKMHLLIFQINSCK